MRLPSPSPNAAGLAVRLGRLSLLVVLASSVAGCSEALRFEGDPFSNPFTSRGDQITTGSVRRAPVPHAAPVLRPAPATRPPYAGGITAAPLPAPGSPAVHQLAVRPASVRVAAARSNTTARAIPGWTARNGTPITLNPGETVETVANRYGVPAAALLHVNGLKSSAEARPGQRLIIPTYSAVFNQPDTRSILERYASDDSATSGTATVHLAFAGGAKSAAAPAFLPEGLLAFAGEGSTGQGHPFRTLSNIAAPISIKPPVQAAPAPRAPVEPTRTKSVVKAEGTPKVARKSGKASDVKSLAKSGSGHGPILAAAPKADHRPAHAAVKSIAKAPEHSNGGAKDQGKRLAKAPEKAPVKAAAKAPVDRKAVASKSRSEPSSSAKGVLTASSHSGKASGSDSKGARPVVASKQIEPSRVSTAPVLATRATTRPDGLSSEVSAYAADPVQTGSLPPAVAQGPEAGLFRWPAKGRIISGFGSRDLNGINNGINISMPEGTPVKAAEAGTVAYSGDDIKKFGKLVLIKHDNGYVSAYAHNGELDVKKGDVVKRGQVIAKSGVTGDVTSPQLHFQLRKGEQPVDPMKLLDTN